MRKKAIFLVLILAYLIATTQAKDLTLINAPAQVYFSPNGGCTEAIVEALGKAKTQILVQAYSFTSKAIAKALVDAHKRGVYTEIILDRSNRSGKYSAADFTAHAGIPTYIDSAHAIAHNKIMIIDKEVIITGSFNFTKAAEEKNAENLLVLRSRELARDYIENWDRHKQHSEIYKGR
jgi:phosphatidylserine/phosphatidylglycerophosphate/cardiolipin synthase-like enzyme